MSSVVLIIVGVAAIAWLAVLVAASVRGGDEEVAPNLAPWMSNDEMETRRLDRVLGVSVVLAGFMAVAIPIYFLGETNRQERFVEAFAEESIERGEVLYTEACSSCHGVGAVGGAAAFVDPRTNTPVTWAAPALNDILYRYDEDEAAFWIIYGRQGSPMPAWGLEGGGPYNEQEVDDIINYLRSVQLPQAEVLARIEPSLTAAENLLAGADAQMDSAIADQEQAIADAEAAPALREDADRIREAANNLVDGFPADWDGGPGEEPPLQLDTDGDGLTDAAEEQLPALVDEALEIGLGAYESNLGPISLDPRNPVTDGLTPDLEVAQNAVANLNNAVILVDVIDENFERTIEPLQAGLEALQQTQENRFWEVDVDEVAEATFGGDTDLAQRAVNLYNAYCARCHTSGWSQGPIFMAPIGTGGFGPSLLPPRARIQFQTQDDLQQFLWQGSESGVGYGVNGIGRGYMPGFGSSLSAEDIDLIVDYLWGDTLGGPDLAEAGG
ncbi:MAG: c-type cytochrome [Acidimicrobiia bacterium]